MKFLVALFAFFLLPHFAGAATDPLLGTWTVTNLPITLPAGAKLKISKANNSYFVLPASTFTVPAPIGCHAATTDILIQFGSSVNGGFAIQYNTYTPHTCIVRQLSSGQVGITFAGANRFTMCEVSTNVCSTWNRVGVIATPPLSTSTTPKAPTVKGNKGALGISWTRVSGVTGYHIVVSGTKNISRTVTSGTSLKLTGLKKGAYKVTIAETFKVSGKTKTTRTSSVTRASVT